jgi:hypothetical protein
LQVQDGIYPSEKYVREAEDFCSSLDKSGCVSIDTFLEFREDLRETGRTAIACTLLPCETEARLSNANASGGDNWYQRLLNWLLPAAGADFPAHRVSILTYNYDRSLEHYVYLALQHRYRCSDAEIAKMMLKLPIVHIHGSFGRLPWQTGDSRAVPYGTDESVLSRNHIIDSANSIKIIFEPEIETSKTLAVARDMLRNATEVLFFGFGYDETNLQRLLAPNPFARGSIAIEGTAFGLTKIERNEKEKLLRTFLTEAQVELFDYNNVSFIRNTRWVLRK